MLSLPRFLSVIYTMMVRACDPAARDKLEESLAWPPDPDEWGTGQEAEAGQAGMMGLMGG